MRIIDLAQDFRLESDDNDYIYGLPELNHSKIQNALHVANPGCFATACNWACCRWPRPDCSTAM